MFEVNRCSVLAGIFVVACRSIVIEATRELSSFFDESHGNGPCGTKNARSATLTLDLYKEHPVLCEMLDRLEVDPEGLAYEMTEFARNKELLVGDKWNWDHLQVQAASLDTREKSVANDGNQLPVVFAHGMGDSCFNSGMINIGKHTSSLLENVYVTCIPTGDTKTEDTTNGYFLNMDASVDVFASKIAQDKNLQNGFHAVGFSQGNNVIRGYIARYNTPTVHTFLSINGVNAGEGTVPGCFPNGSGADQKDEDHLGSFCDLLLEQASRRAYTEFAQEHSFQSNYWRDPRDTKLEDYYEYSQLARWNNEGPNNHNETLKENFGKTSKFIWVKATHDSMVWPGEGEHWGCPDAKDPFENPVLMMNQTEWYKEDLFGLKTAQEAGKNVFESFEGDHLQFSMDDFDRWIHTYLKDVALSQRQKEQVPSSIASA